MDRETLIEKARTSEKESKYIDFKESCHTDSVEMWCEIVKDIVAMANSGGGVIVVGLKNDGTRSTFDCGQLLAYDIAKVTDKIAKYTGRQFAEIEITPLDRSGDTVAAIVILESPLPIVFTTAGTYVAQNGKEKISFQQGTVYFRHGAKSEPGNSEDIKRVIDREVERTRKTWMMGIRKVTQAPPGSVIQVATKIEPSHGGLSGRIVTDLNAPAVRPEEADTIWPHRAKEVRLLINERLKGEVTVNTYDLQCLRQAFNIDRDHRDWCYRPFAKAHPQYSDTFVNWVVNEFKKDDQFFVKVRQQVHDNGTKEKHA
jgi:hypothetical protein